MLSAFVLVSMVAASPQPAIAVTRFRLVQVAPELGGYAEDRLAHRLALSGFQVTTPADLETMLGLERQRTLLGCNDETSTSCLAEISAALGVPLVAAGRLTRLGKRLEVDVRVIRQKDGQVAASDTRWTDDESRLGELLEQAALALAEQLAPKAAPVPFRWRLWIPFAAGVAALLGGGALIATAEIDYAGWTTPGSSAGVLKNGEVSLRFQDLSLRRGAGIGLAALGAALITTGLVWNAVAADAPVSVSLGGGPDGASVWVRGSF